MSHLSIIKTRIKSIEKTQKITKAMRMIAMSQYSRLEKQRTLITSYRDAIASMTALLNQQSFTLPPLVEPVRGQARRPLIILCSSSRGMCGSLNISMARFFEQNFITEGTARPSFIGIGSRACAYLNHKKPGSIVDAIESYSLNTLEDLVSSLITHIEEETERPYTSVQIYYTKVKNLFIQMPEREQLLPHDISSSEDDATPSAPQGDYLWEQDMQSLGIQIARTYLHAQLSHALFNNIISENAARFVAMDQSTTNANKYIESLSMTYNKSRQSIITRELAELSSNL